MPGRAGGVDRTAPSSPIPVTNAARAAEYSGEWREAVSFYRKLLKSKSLDAGIAADQYDGAGHEPAAEHAIELGVLQVLDPCQRIKPCHSVFPRSL